jgi:uncharacterized repeat protein (TIGR02543 family)
MKKYLSILMVALLTLFAACIIYNDDGNDDENSNDGKTVYTVTFETDGGAPVPSVQKVEEGGTVITPSINPAKVGYAFVFWHLRGATTAYNFQTPVSSNITLHAKWQKEAEYWQVSWELNGGSWPSDDNHATQALKGGTLAEPATPVKAGSTFDGWYKESALTNKITFPYDLSNVTSNFTLYAKWTIVITDPDIAFFARNPVTESLYKNGFFYGSRVNFDLVVYDAAGSTSITIEEVASGAPNGNSKEIRQKRVISISGAGTYSLSQEMWNGYAGYGDIYSRFTYTVSAFGKSYTRTYSGSYSSYNGAWNHYFGIKPSSE